MGADAACIDARHGAAGDGLAMDGRGWPGDVDVPLERDAFLRSMLRELAGVLERVVGEEEAAGYVSIVGAAIGRQIDRAYKDASGTERFDADQVAAVLVDLKRRIRGGFRIVEADADRIVLDNDACPFAEKVLGRPSMCMMTSNVFGHIAAENLGYAKVELQRTIARGDPGCRVVVYLRPTAASERAIGREYVAAEDCPVGET